MGETVVSSAASRGIHHREPYIARRLFIAMLQDAISVTPREIVFTVLVAASTYAYQWSAGRVARDDTLSIILPGVFTICVLGIWYTLRAAWHLHSDDIKEWDGWDTVLVLNWILPKAVSVACSVGLGGFYSGIWCGCGDGGVVHWNSRDAQRMETGGGDARIAATGVPETVLGGL